MVLEPYNQRIKLKKDVLRVRKKTIPKLKPMLKDYDRVITILGKKYLDVLSPIINRKFYIVYDRRGIGGYKQKVKKMNELNKTELKEFLKPYKYKPIKR